MGFRRLLAQAARRLALGTKTGQLIDGLGSFWSEHQKIGLLVASLASMASLGLVC